MTPAERRAISNLVDHVDWLTSEVLNQVSDERFAELQRKEILGLLESVYGDDAEESQLARITLDRHGLSAPDFVPNDLVGR